MSRSFVDALSTFCLALPLQVVVVDVAAIATTATAAAAIQLKYEVMCMRILLCCAVCMVGTVSRVESRVESSADAGAGAVARQNNF